MTADPGYIPAPYPEDEEERQDVVTRLLSHGFDLSQLQSLVEQVADAFDVPMAAATVLDKEWQHLPGKVGLDGDRTERALAFCGYTISHAKPFVVLNTEEDQRFAGHPFVREDPSIRFYAGARIIVDGMPIGSLCAIGQKAQTDVDQSLLDQLERLAGTASDLLNAQFAGQADS